jgi:imidazole glycerol-phosphate synthase subunit HisF
METVRIISRLDIKGPNVVKGIHLEGLRVIGQPDVMARYYYESGADELFFMDVVASLYERNSLEEIISKTASEIFIPFTVGGGIRTVKDISKALHAGADKVCLNTAAIKDPNIIKQASRTFGSSTIVVAIEAIREPTGKYLAYSDNGREHTGFDVFDWAKKIEDLGAGEIVVTSVDREGTGEGFDIDLICPIAQAASIPVIAHGGAGKAEDVVMAIDKGQADGVTVASILHYEFIRNNESSSATDLEGNVEFLNKKVSNNNICTATIKEIKQTMHEAGICVRGGCNS